VLRKEHTQGPRCLGFPSGSFPLLCTHLFYSHPFLPGSVCDTHTQTQTSNPKPRFLDMPTLPSLKSCPGFGSPFPCLPLLSDLQQPTAPPQPGRPSPRAIALTSERSGMGRATCPTQPNPVSLSCSAHVVGTDTYGYRCVQGSLHKRPPAHPFKHTHSVQRVFFGAFNQVGFKSTQARPCNGVAVGSGPGQIPPGSARASESVAGGGVVPKTIRVGSGI